MKRTLRCAAMGGILTLLSTIGSGALAQTPMTLPLEEVGMITAVSPATSTITVEGRKLLITSDTRVTSDERALDHSVVSNAWVGRQAALDVGQTSGGQAAIRQIHIFGNADQ